MVTEHIQLGKYKLNAKLIHTLIHLRKYKLNAKQTHTLSTHTYANINSMLNKHIHYIHLRVIIQILTRFEIGSNYSSISTCRKWQPFHRSFYFLGGGNVHF